MLFISPTNKQLRYVLRIYFPASNNVAEYEAYLHDMRIAVELGVKHLYVYGDSALVINQLNKDWDTASEKMDAYSKEIRKLKDKFYGIEYTHMVCDKNQAANALSKLGSSRAQAPQGVFIQDLVKPSIKEEEDQVVEKPLD
jgi:ribonuclease HI